MKGREGKGPPSTDLLVCFPTRAHLTLMPKPICSPARSSEPNKRHHNHHHQRKLTGRAGGQASPLLWSKSKTSEMISEPTSPKVTCAGQIKVGPARAAKPGSCKNWQSVMEEIERLHNSQKYKRKPTAWMESTFGFKKDVMQFLTCLRNIRFDFRCFGSFPSTAADVTSDEDDDDDEENYNNNNNNNAAEESESSRTMFSKWFMVLQENNQQNPPVPNFTGAVPNSTEVVPENPPCGPPPNALLLMRCRSAPAKSWLEELQDKQEEEDEEEDEEEKEERINDEKNKKSLVVMKYGKDFYKFSSDIAKETWVVGGITDPLSRSRSWKR